MSTRVLLHVGTPKTGTSYLQEVLFHNREALLEQGMVLPVTVYMAVLGAMVCAALLAALPTPWTALGAVCFAVSDSMIGISKFVLGSEALAVPIWWAYAASLFLITAGFFFGRRHEIGARWPQE